MKLKKMLSLLIASAMLLSSMAVEVFANSTADAWDGETSTTDWYYVDTDADVFYINSASDFAGLADLVNSGVTKFSGKTVKLTVDIDLDQNNWTPIGSDETDRSFRGSFDGQGHTISNLWICESDDFIGLFGYAGVGGDQGTVYFKDFTLNNATVISNITNSHDGSYVGGVVGNCRVCTFDNVDLTGEIIIQGYGYVGGIIGHGYATMTNCDVFGFGTINCHYWCCGALIGYMGEGMVKGISDCTVVSDEDNGGLTLWSAYGGIGAACGLLQDGSTLDSIVAKDVAVKSNSDYCVGYISGGNSSTNSSADNITVFVNDEEFTPNDISFVAKVDGVTYTSLQDAFNAAVAAQSNVTVTILKDINLEGVDWDPVSVSAPAGLVTVEGNNKTITNLNNMLFSGTWAGNSGLIIKNLTIADSTIVHDENDESGTIGVGAFIGYPQASETITLSNCHLKNSTVKGGHWTGGMIGMAGGYNGNDGPVFMNLTIENCSVINTTVNGKGSVGGIIGHGSCAAWTNVEINDVTVTGNSITSTGDSSVKAGSICGTVGAAGQPTTADGETKTGGLFVDANVSGNTVTSNGTTITTIYGRQGTQTGILKITGGTYDFKPLNENDSWAAVKDGYELKENTDGSFGVVEMSGITWGYDQDSGFYYDGETKFGMIRFLFAAKQDGEIEEYGIRYSKADDITEEVTADGKTVNDDGDINAFYGDLYGIEENDETRYYAIAFIKVNGKYLWSDIVNCTPNWNNNYSGYTGGNE